MIQRHQRPGLSLTRAGDYLAIGGVQPFVDALNSGNPRTQPSGDELGDLSDPFCVDQPFDEVVPIVVADRLEKRQHQFTEDRQRQLTAVLLPDPLQVFATSASVLRCVRLHKYGCVDVMKRQGVQESAGHSVLLDF